MSEPATRPLLSRPHGVRAPARVHVAGAWRAHFGVWAMLAGVTFVAYALAAPPAVAADATLLAGMSAVWLVLARAAGLFALGDPAGRLRLVSSAAAAVLVVVQLRRACGDEHITRGRPGEPGHAREPRDPPHIVAAFFAALTVAASRSVFHAATTAGPVATGALLAVAALTLAERVVRAPSDARAGLGLALTLGASAGGPMSAAALGAPLGALAVLRALRRGARWPRLAPVLPAIIGGLSLGVLACAPGSPRAAELARRLVLAPVAAALAHLSVPALVAAATDLADQIGVVGLLVAGAGILRLRRISLVFTLWPLVGGLVLRAALAGAGGGGGPGEGQGEGEGMIGAIVAAAALVLPLGVGTAHLAERLGRAALPAAAAVGIIIATWPLFAR